MHPMFAHINRWQWTPDLDLVDKFRLFGTANYEVQNRCQRVGVLCTLSLLQAMGTHAWPAGTLICMAVASTDSDYRQVSGLKTSQCLSSCGTINHQSTTC